MRVYTACVLGIVRETWRQKRMRCSDNDDYFDMIKFVVDVYIRPVSSVNDVRMVQI